MRRLEVMADFRKWSLTYVVAYLTVGGLGFALAPDLTFDIFLSNGEYDTAGFRLTGMLMLGLAYLIWSILRREDWKYYPVSIVVRSAFVVFMLWLYVLEDDPMFLVIDAIVLVGLIPSLMFHFRGGPG